MSKIFPQILFIINPRSGQLKKENPVPEIIMLFAEHGYETIVCYTTQAGDATRLVEEHAGDNIEMIVCMGGDGTLNETLAGVYRIQWKKKVGYIPAGTTNDFASSLGIPGNPMDAARNIMNGKEHRLDIGKFNDRTFVYTACCGMFTNTSYETSQAIKNRLGHVAYIMEGMKEGMKELFTPGASLLKSIYMEIITDEKTYRGNYLFVGFCNTFSLGGIMTLDENDVSLTDGLFELLLIEEPNDLLQFNEIIKSLRDQTYASSLVTMAKVRKATIRYLSGEDWSLDGERGIGETENVFEVIPGIAHMVF